MAGLINDDWDGLCDVKLLINDKEHSCNFTPSQLHLECILLLAATAKPSNPVHRGCVSRPESRLGNREAQTRNQCTSHMSGWLAGSTEIHWVQLVAGDSCFSQPKKNSVHPLRLQAILESSWRSKPSNW